MTTWKDYPDTSTPITAAALNDLESRADLALSTANSAAENLADTTENLTTRVSKLENRPVIQGGTVSNIAAIANGATGSVTITFPKKYMTTPVVIVTPTNSRYTPEVTSASASGATVTLRNSSGVNASGTSSLQWVAVPVSTFVGY